MSRFDDTLVDVLAARIRYVLDGRHAGHCAQVPHVPPRLADRICERLVKGNTPGERICVVVERPSQPWHASPAKVVEYRNDVETGQEKLLVLVPAGSHLPVEDSFGTATFEVIDTSGVYDESRRQSLEKLRELKPDLAERVEAVLDHARKIPGIALRDDAGARFVSDALSEPTAAGVGRALTHLGLIPDGELIAQAEDEVGPRLRRNLQQMERLSTPDAPADRVRAVVPVDGEAASDLRAGLMSALGDAPTDRWAIAERLAQHEATSDTHFDVLVAKEASAPVINELQVLRLKGDLDDSFDPPRTKSRQPQIKASIRCVPAARTIVGLDHLRLSVLHRPDRSAEYIDVGVQKTKKVASTARSTDFTWSVRLDAESLEPGLYVVRVDAIDEDNFVQRTAESDVFVVHEVSASDADIERDVTGLVTATMEAWLAGGRHPGGVTITRTRPSEKAKTTESNELYVIRFDDAPGSYRLVLPKELTRIESWSIANPRDPYNYTLLASNPEEEMAQVVGLPEPFLDAREEALRAIEAHQLISGEDAPVCVATCAMPNIAEAAAEYLASWRTALEGADPRTRTALLSLDQATVEGFDDCVLVGPTHPLRLAWLVRHHEQMMHAVTDRDLPEPALKRLIRLADGLSPENVPHVVINRGRELRFLESLSLEWGIWVHPASPTGGAAAAELRSRLSSSPRTLSGVSAADIVARIKRYLAAHPYVSTLDLNVVHPGAGELLLDVLLTLQSDSEVADTRYTLRLFSQELSRSRVGAALDAFMADPQAIPARRKDAADAFLASTDDILAPKLTYSKHELAELAETPERFPAHLSIFVDWFELDAVPVPPLQGRRSFFADGVIVDPVVVFRPSEDGLDPQWDEHVVTPPPGDSFGDAYRASEMATATHLGSESLGAVPAIRLRLDRVRRTILDAVHRTSDWVVVIDPVFTEEFLDSQRQADDSPRYLIDAEEREALHTSRNIVVSTRSRLELSELLRPALAAYALEVADERIEALLDAMHALNPGLALRLLNAPRHAVEALTLGLAAMELEATGVLRHSLVIPLDLHQELFREELDLGAGRIEALSRTDLAIVRPRPQERALDIHLIEVKARADLPAALPTTFLEGIAGQLQNSFNVLRGTLLGLDERATEPDVASALRARRLMRLLTRYADRAERYGYLTGAAGEAARDFLITLDDTFEVSFVLHGLVFDLGPNSCQEDVPFGQIQVHRVARDRVSRLLERAPTRMATRPALREVQATDLLDTTPPAERAVVPRSASAPAGPDLAPTPDPYERSTAIGERDDTGGRSGGPEDEADAERPPLVPGPALGDVSLLGQASASSQFGIVGHIKANQRPAAFDVDGTNVVSVFGVQGAGKSYTVGNLIEAALLQEPALNRLKKPLGVVVFHYSTNQGYKPEFASMIDPNDAQSEQLAELGASPRGLDDVHLIVPEDLVDERRAEFDGRLPVHPLVLAPDELVLNDWKLLMGVEGGEQMYVKTMTTLLKSQRKNLSLDGLRAAVDDSRLTPAQKNNADIRLDFVANFVSDSGGVSSVLQPGRLVIVDVRDPLMEQEEALALFMVLLRAFSQGADSAGRPFNRLIVFDEAHKYMENPRLTTAIVEAIREMRHKGTSVVIASQNPPSVPKEVIELSSVVVAHRFMSPQWLDHVKKVNAAFAADITPPQLAKLEPGEAFVYASGGDSTFRRPQLVRMRPRLTRHGGATRRAVTED